MIGVFSVLSEFEGEDYSLLPFSKKFDDEKLAREFFNNLHDKASDHHDDGLFDFLQENFGHEEFDVCNLRIDGLFKIAEEKLK
jgi:ferritin